MAIDIPVNKAIIWGLNYQNPVNWFKVTLPADGDLTIITYSDPPFERNTYIYVAEDIPIAETQKKNLAKGTYYIRVSLVSGGGNYTINCQFVRASLESDIEPNTTVETADTLDVNVLDSGHLGYYSIDYTEAQHIDKTDWWVTTLASDGSVEITIEPDETLNTGFELYDQDKKVLLGASEGGSGIQSLKRQDLSSGAYYIKVFRSGEDDSYGSYSIINSFNPPVHENDPEPNNFVEEATRLSLDSIDTGHLGFYGNGNTDTNDWWEVITTSDGSLTVSVVSDSTVYIKLMLHDHDTSVLLASQIGTGNVKVQRNDLLPGTYYVNAQRWGISGSGSYTIAGTFTLAALDNDPESNNSAVEASVLSLDGSDTGHLGFYGNGYRDQYDWWKITTISDGSLLISVTSDSTLGVTLFLFDQNTTAHLGNNSGIGSVTVRRDDLSPGTYYVRMEPDGAESYGPYTLSSVFTSTSFVNDPEPNDSAEEAANLDSDGTDTGHLGYYSNQNRDTSDWWKVTTTKDGSLTITTDSDPTLELYLYLYGQDKTTLLAQSIAASVTQIVRCTDLAAGTYYIEALRHDDQGSYTISAVFAQSTLENDDEPNDSLENADDIVTGKTYTGHLGYRTNGSADNNDYFTFILLAAWDDLYIASESDTTLQISMSLYDINGSQIIFSDTSGTRGQLHYHEAEAGSYYVKFNKKTGYGSYAFIISGSPDTRPIFKNYPPVIITKSFNDAITGQYYECTIEAEDPDEGDVLTFELLDAPNWLVLDSNGVLKGTPGENDIGTDIPVLVRVVDLGGYTDYLSGKIDVIEFNVSPPSDVTVSDVPDDHGYQIQVTWILSLDDDIVTNYHIYRSRSPEFTEPIPVESLESIEELIRKERKNTIHIDSVPGGVNTYIDRCIPKIGVDYYYWLQAEASMGSSEKVAAESVITLVEKAPLAFRVHPPYPNPFNPVTAIRFEIPFECYVSLTVYDILGREIVALENGAKSAGIHETVWDGTDKNSIIVSSGVYLYCFEAGNEFVEHGKLMFLR